jgi:hypothetical protein
VARLGLPDEFRVANQNDQRGALERAYDRAIGRGDDPHRFWRLRMDRYRRSYLDRNAPAFRGSDPETARLVLAYEDELRTRGLIDFDDMPLLSVRALRENPWLQEAIKAKFPVLIVDEYQDLGRALHSMVMGLCFTTGIRLFAVGDVDQSIYGFTGANPELLQRLSERENVEVARLRLNYRCGSSIVAASQFALGEDRGYRAPEDAAEGTIYFHPLQGTYEDHAEFLFETLLPAAMERMPGIQLGQIAILYPAAWIGDAVADAAQEHGYVSCFSPEERAQRTVAVAIAQRLLAADRPADALEMLDAADTARGDFGAQDWEAARINALDALGRADEAQEMRWTAFARRLDAQALRAFLKRLPDFDDIDAEERAMDHAAASLHTLQALSYFLAWPELDRAAALIVARGAELDGDAYTLLTPAADTLAQTHPLAATLCLRAMVDFTLGDARSSRYGHAARHLAICARLARQIDDWSDVADHNVWVGQLRADHSRKTGFWARVK